ncbi:Vacuolar inheritance and morphology protein [Mucor velutinosus]|uniref:Vacuolar inheritance and morphology protein n=1 Tax=Mucor velutinosus TaxID=708070 RepID=A0AAN7D682_9FUNG|nr:Vacuolar inheritance and morphology protein [Mucor velutinosus]
MANNNSIFVPQTFNGARMVNVTKRTPTSSSTSLEATAATTVSHPAPDATAATNDAPSSEPKKDSKPDTNAVDASPKAKVIAIKPYASSQSVIDTRTKSSHTSRTSIPTSSSSSKAPIVPSPAAEQQPQATPIPVQPRVSPQQQIMHPHIIIQPSFPGPYDVVGYERVWSEANVAVLIQLHRKHYNGVTSMDMDQQNAAWTALTSEYNAITADNRSTPALIKKWGKLMAKYNAERAFLIMPRPQGLQQPVPTVSYWNHFQYMDSYLSHVPIPENCILKRKRRERDNEESDSSDQITAATTFHTKRLCAMDLNMKLLETQRVFMEKTLDKQNTQIEMMKANAESMHKMNMKFVNICEKACTRSQTNEERYLNLLEKCLVLNNKDYSKKNVASAVISELQQQTKGASPRPESPTLSTYSSASSELAKAVQE